MKNAVKLLSAVTLLGSAFVSFNAHADCRCATGVPIGGNNCGIPNQGTGGWQHIFPMTCTADTSSRSTYQEPVRQLTPKEQQQMWSTLNSDKLIIVVNHNTDKIYMGGTTVLDNMGVEESLLKQCRQAGGECSSVNSFDVDDLKSEGKKCGTIYKKPTTYTTGRGIFQRKVPSYDYFLKVWTTQAERAKAYETIKYGNNIAVKDICPN